MKNPFRYRSPRSTRIVYGIAALIVFSITVIHLLDVMVFRVTSNDECGWVPPPAGRPGLIITNIVPGGITDRAGVRDGDTLLRINGQEIQVASAGRILNALQPGDTATYLINRHGTLLEARIRILKLFDTFSLTLFLLGFSFLLVGTIVVMTKPEGFIQRAFGRYGLFTMLVFGLFTASIDPMDPWWKNVSLVSGYIIGHIFGGPQFILFFRDFPTRNVLLGKRWVKILLYSLSVAFMAFIILGTRLGFPPSFLTYMLISPIAFLVVGVGVFISAYRRMTDPTARNQLRPILIGFIFGFVVFTYITIFTAVNPFLFFLQPTSMLPIVLILLMPASFGYAIFRYRLMDIDLIIERSLIYGAVTASLAGVYVIVVFGIGSLLGMLIGQPDSKILSIVAFVVIAFIFDPVKRRAQEGIDRTFYRERRNYQRALLEFSQELPRLINLGEILDSILSRISSTMHVEKIAVVLCDDQTGCSSVTKNIDGDCCNFTAAQNGLISRLRTTRVAQLLTFIGDESEADSIDPSDRENIRRSGIILAVPLLLQERLIGLITVGPKSSGKVYSQDDIDLLTTVASQAAIAIENSRLHRSELEKEKIQEELEMARKIQQGLLPKADPVMEHLDISGISIPALTVGGDYFDYILLGPGKLLTVVADVSGKGMSAALYMSKVQGMIQLAGRMYESPKEMLIHVNRLLYQGIERKSFITMILALFDLERNNVTICRAGHNKAIIATGGTVSLLQSAGIGLGLEHGAIFDKTLEEVEYPLNGKSSFVFYSDGLTETMNGQRQELGEDALFDIIKHHGGSSAVELRGQLLAAAESFRGDAEQLDDITIVVVRTK